MPLSKLEALVIKKCGLYRRQVKFLLLWLADMFIFAITLPLSLFVRLDFHPSFEFLSLLLNKYFLIGALCFTLTSAFFKTYSTIIRLANLNTALRIAMASLCASIAFYATTNHILNYEPIPRSLFLIQTLLFIPLATLCRFSFRLAEKITKIFEAGVPTIIYGAGRTTNIYLPALLKPASGVKVLGLIDDDRNKRRGEVQGVSVLGKGDDLPELVKKLSIEQVIICMPTLDGVILRKLVAKLRDLAVTVKIAPEVNDYINSNTIPEKIGLRDLNIEDLLRRSPRKVDQNEISSMVKDQTVLVTGGGGSIGSELCRQIIAMNPKLLLVNDASEFNLYNIIEELREHYPSQCVHPHLGDLSHEGTASALFRDHSIDLVFHAAAYKHVPLVEENINVSIQNNVAGTYNLFKAAWDKNVKRVVLVSSDKAVNPTNAMGATKRLGELIGLWFSQQDSSTIFSAVRFGNVLGSSGSVIPKFLKQIKNGGPVSITHPDITRYFMLIPEAVSLVLQASKAGGSGELYVLDMGEPIKILDLARDLIGIMGFKEGVDINIQFTGLRPGEKMFEELYLGHEKLERVSDDFYRVATKETLGKVFHDNLLLMINELDSRTSDENRQLLFDLINTKNSVPYKSITLTETCKKKSIATAPANNEIIF